MIKILEQGQMVFNAFGDWSQASGMARSEVSRMLSTASGFGREKDGRKVLFYVQDDAP